MPCARWLALPLCAVLLLCSCAAPAARPASTVAEDPPAQSPPQAESLKMALLLDSPIDDGGWNADCHAGLTQARDILGYTIAAEENLAPQDFEAAFRRYAGEGYQLIIAPGGQYESAVAAVYRDYPGSHFAGINFTLTVANVTALNFNNVQAGFLAGAMAGLLTQTGSVGYIGGDEIPSTIDALRGMGQGVKCRFA